VRWEDKAPNERISPTHWEGHCVRDLTIGYILRQQAERRGAAPYLHDLSCDRLYSFADVDRLTNRMANSLLALGVKPREHVCVMLENSAACLLAHLAIGKIGAVSVPVSTAQRGASLAHILTTAEIVAVLAEATCSAAVLATLSQAPGVRLVVTRGTTGTLEIPATIAHVEFESLETGSQARPGVDVRFCDPAFIMFTSGTTGPAKGNVFTHAAAIMWEQAAPRIWGIGPDDVYYFCVSMAHAAGLFGIAYLMAAVGGRVALAARFSAANFLDDVRRSHSTVAMLLGAMGNFVENLPERADDNDNSLRLLLSGPMPKDPVRLRQRFGIDIAQGYGLTDHSSFAKLPLGAEPAKLGSVGKVIEPFEALIVDEDDFPLPHSIKGEILVRARYPWHGSSGYYKRPADSMSARANDWFHTGDRGYLDADGYLYFVDRKKDAIRRRGENISAFEVERVILDHPDVAEAAVYAVESDLSEDEVCLSVVAREGSALDLPSLIRFCIKHMPGYMVPRFVHAADQLPKTLTQRVEKYKLRQWAASHRDCLWDREASEEFRRIR
jgi:crotonobetaine/carnitine-CoA ligase